MMTIHYDGLSMWACKNSKLPGWSFKAIVADANCWCSLQQLAEEEAVDAEPESDLGQLPGHHPLIKDGMSDEGQSC